MTPPNPARAKILKRARDLLARAKSDNVHEAQLAKQRADELIAKHAITPAEIASLTADPASRRYAEDIPEHADWRLELALTIATKHGCKALRARGKLFFEGGKATDAVAQYRRVANEIAISCRAWWEAHGNQHVEAAEALWNRVFSESATSAFADPTGPVTIGYLFAKEWIAIKSRHHMFPNLHSIVQIFIRQASVDGHHTGYAVAKSEAMSATRAPHATALGESFLLRPGFVLVTSGRPGNFATLFLGRADKLAFRGDLSAFDDSHGSYTWVFESPALGWPRKIIFATSDRAAVGEISGDEVHVTSTQPRIHRDPSGEPMHVIDHGD